MSEFPMYPECGHCGVEPADNHSTAECRDRLSAKAIEDNQVIREQAREIAKLATVIRDMLATAHTDWEAESDEYRFASDAARKAIGR